MQAGHRLSEPCPARIVKPGRLTPAPGGLGIYSSTRRITP
jgi:hypothetical protein